MPNKPVLLVGLHQDAVDYTKWPDLSPDKLKQAFSDVRSQLAAAGYDAHWCLLHAPTKPHTDANQTLTQALAEHRPDVVLIGAGVRADPDHHILFEQLINTIHAEASNAKIAFNTSPFDSVEAVQRWA